MAGMQGDELPPAHAGLDGGLDQEPVAVRDRCDEYVVLSRGEGAGPAGDDLREFGVFARVGHDELVADRSFED